MNKMLSLMLKLHKSKFQPLVKVVLFMESIYIADELPPIFFRPIKKVHLPSEIRGDLKSSCDEII